MTRLEAVARAIKWARTKDEVTSTDLNTGRHQFMRDVASQETIHVDESDLFQARAAVEVLRDVDDPLLGFTFQDDWNGTIDAILNEKPK